MLLYISTSQNFVLAGKGAFKTCVLNRARNISPAVARTYIM